MPMIPDLASEPTVRAATQLHQANQPRAALKHKLLLALTVPCGCYLIFRGLSVPIDTADPIAGMAGGLIRGLEFMGGFVCFYVALRAFFRIRRSRK